MRATTLSHNGPNGVTWTDDDRLLREERDAIVAEGASHAERRVFAERDRLRTYRDARRLLEAEDRCTTTLPEIETLRDRLARPVPDVRWRIRGWQPANSRVILAAPSKAGKTTLRDGLVRSLVDGDAFLGVAPVNAVTGTVAIVDSEMSSGQLDHWLRGQRIRNDDRVLVAALRGAVSTFDIIDRATRARWAARFKARRVEYLILDCFRPVLDALGLDESHDAGRLLVAIDSLLAEAEISDALVVHHMGHGAERSRGDSRLRDWPDIEWKIVRQEDGDRRFISAFGRDVDVTESGLDYDSATRRLTLAGGSRRDAKSESALGAVIELLSRTSEPLSGRAVKKALDESEFSRDRIDEALAHGVRTGALSAHEGAKKARLYRVSASVRTVSGGQSTNRVSECPAASIEAGHRDTRGSSRGLSQ